MEKVYIVKIATSRNDYETLASIDVCTTKEVALKDFKRRIEEIKNDSDNVFGCTYHVWKDEVEEYEEEDSYYATNGCGAWVDISIEEKDLYDE